MGPGSLSVHRNAGRLRAYAEASVGECPNASGVRDIAAAIAEDSLDVFPLDASSEAPARRARKTQVDKRELWAVVPRSVKGRRMISATPVASYPLLVALARR